MRTKYQVVADVLRLEIQSGEYDHTMVLPTEQALCTRFQVSRQTVRQALSLLAADGLIQRRQGSGSHITKKVRGSSQNQRHIAVITTYISNYIFPSVLREIETVLAGNNSAPTLYATQNQIANERRILLTLLEGRLPDGVLVEGTKTALPNPNLDLYRELMDRQVPVVFMHGSYRELPGCVCVMDDNYRGGQQLVEYLHRKGHRAIFGIFKSDDIQGLQRYAGYTHALRDLGLPLEDQPVYWYNTEEKDYLFSQDPQWTRTTQLLCRCTAVVCYNDEVASRLVSWLLSQGVKVPQEMAVVSFDNSAFSQLSAVPITSLSHQHYNVGRMAAQLLVDQMNGHKVESQVAPWELIERESG